MESDAIKELVLFLTEADFVPQHDVNMIMSLYQRLPVTRMKLEAHADAHMDMTADLSYLTSKYQAIHRKAEAALKAHDGGLLRDHRQREYPQWMSKGIIDSDPEHVVLLDKAADRFRVADMLDRLWWAMRQRETMVNYFRKLDGY